MVSPAFGVLPRTRRSSYNCVPLSVGATEYAAKFYRDADRDDEFHNRQTPTLGGRGRTVQTCQRLIPIPVGWAHMFLDNPTMGVAYRRMIQLMMGVAVTIRRAAIHGIHAVFPPTLVTHHKDGKEPISTKKLAQGDGNFDTKKEMIGFVFDGVKCL
jgi:hypothetical protein